MKVIAFHLHTILVLKSPTCEVAFAVGAASKPVPHIKSQVFGVKSRHLI